MNWLETLRRCFEREEVLYSSHARREMRSEEYGAIHEDEIDQAIRSGEAIEEYPEDRPYPSALVLGFTKSSRALHIVCAYDYENDRAIVITAYEPDPERWVEQRWRKK